MRPKLTTVSLLACLAFTPLVHAQWAGKAEAGLLISQGNAESTSANAKLDLTHEGERWKNAAFLAALYGENAEFATAERYEARWQSDWKITERFSWFGALRGEQDRFSGFAWQATASTGASFKVIDSPATQFGISVGVGYRRLKEEVLVKSDAGEVLDRIEGATQSDAVATLASGYEHAFTENTKITNRFLAESGGDNTSIANDLALQVNMTDTLGLSIGYAVRYNTDPPALAESTDTLTTVNLVYNIK